VTDIVDPASLGYAEQHTTPLDGELAELAGWTQAHTASPGMMSGLAEARLLQALIVGGGARRVLEIGTFTALGTLAMAAALADGGRITTLEVDPDMAATARRHIGASPFGARVELIEGDALKSLADLDGPFDVVYIDARKSEYPAYYEAVVPKLAPRGVIVADNLYRAGRALDPAAADDDTAGIREFARLVQADPRTDNALLTIGDGLMLAWRRPPGGVAVKRRAPPGPAGAPGPGPPRAGR
jgi:predicted O-methyltransferase YrrM